MYTRVAAAGVLLLATVSQSVAGGYATACYEPVYQAPVYRTVYEQVMVSPGERRVEMVPAVYGTQRRRVVVQPERVGYRVVPAEYGFVKEKVMISPERTAWRTIPAVTETRYRKVLAGGGGTVWEWRVINGRRVLCEVVQPPVYRDIAETVVVRPAQKVREVIPARWGWSQRQVVVRPAYKERYVIPAEYGYVNEQVLVRPAQKRVYRTEPVYRTVARQVMVSEGSSGWRRVHVKGHCQ